MIYFTSDTHFCAERTLNLSKRPFKNVEEMDKKIIENWNNTVTQEDIVYHIGDFGNFDIIKRLNGKIILICGNYEEEEIKVNFKNSFQEFKAYLLSLGFADVYQKSLTLELQDFDKKVFLTHKPLDCKKDFFNIFGHIHRCSIVKEFGINVGIDNNFYAPFSLDLVKFFKRGIDTFYDRNVFCETNDLKD